MNHKISVFFLGFAVLLMPLLAGADIAPGKTLKTKVNLHPDSNKRVLYTLNYQLNGGMIPVCEDIKIVKVKKKVIVFEWSGMEYRLLWDGHTKKAGVSLMTVADEFMGESCPEKKIATMSKVDKEGIRSGLPEVGMSKEAILIAMGRPPFHANPKLEVATFTYWINRYKRKLIEFDEKNKVANIRL